MDVPTSLVKYEKWVLEYRPNGLKYSDMIGGIKQAEKDRHELFGDIGSDPRDSNAPRKLTFTKPANGSFVNAMEAAAKANPEVSAYAWSAALELLSTKVLADKQVSMGIELRCYLDQFYQYREVAESYQMIARAPSLTHLARQCHQHNNNPRMAFDFETYEEPVAAPSPPKPRLRDNANNVHNATRRSPTRKKQAELQPLTHSSGRKYGKMPTKPKQRQPFLSGQPLAYLAAGPTRKGGNALSQMPRIEKQQKELTQQHASSPSQSKGRRRLDPLQEDPGPGASAWAGAESTPRRPIASSH